ARESHRQERGVRARCAVLRECPASEHATAFVRHRAAREDRARYFAARPIAEGRVALTRRAQVERSIDGEGAASSASRARSSASLGSVDGGIRCGWYVAQQLRPALFAS